MHRTLKLLSAVCALALTACSAPRSVPYSPPPRPQIDPLPPDLQLTEAERTLCRRLLLTFSATERQLQDSCGNTSDSPNASNAAGQ